MTSIKMPLALDADGNPSAGWCSMVITVRDGHVSGTATIDGRTFTLCDDGEWEEAGDIEVMAERVRQLSTAHRELLGLLSKVKDILATDGDAGSDEGLILDALHEAVRA